jgi:hypothetical protein
MIGWVKFPPNKISVSWYNRRRKMKLQNNNYWLLGLYTVAWLIVSLGIYFTGNISLLPIIIMPALVVFSSIHN